MPLYPFGGFQTIAINGYGEILMGTIKKGGGITPGIPFGVDERGYFFWDEWHHAKWYYSPKRILIAEAPCCICFRSKRCFDTAVVCTDISPFVPAIVYLGERGLGRVLR